MLRLLYQKMKYIMLMGVAQDKNPKCVLYIYGTLPYSITIMLTIPLNEKISLKYQ